MGKTFFVSEVTGNEYDTEDYVNHGYGGLKNGYKDLPHGEYPYSYRIEKSLEELTDSFMSEVFKELNGATDNSKYYPTELRWVLDPFKSRRKDGAYIEKVYSWAHVPISGDSEASEEADEYDKRLMKATANWIINVLLDHLKKNGLKSDELPRLIEPWRLKELVGYVEFTDLIDFSTGKKVLEVMLETGEDAWTVMERLDLLYKAEKSELEAAVDAVLSDYPDKVEAYKGGKTGLLGMFVGEVMRNMKGVNGKEVQALFRKKLE